MALGEPDAKRRLKRYLSFERLGAVMRRSGRATAAFTGGGEAAAVFGPIHSFDRITEHTRRADRMETLVGHAAEFIERRRYEPFFIFIHSAAVSSPWTDARYAGKSPSRRLKGGFGFPDGPEARGRFRPTVAETDYARALYDGDLAAADEAVGGLVDGLRRAGVLDRTVLAVTSTCGAELFERGWWGTGHGMTEEFLRVPLVIAGPGIEKRRVTGPVRLERVAPAILCAAGVETPLAGRSPGPIEAGADAVIVSGWPGGGEGHWAVRAGGWKLIAGGRDLAKRRLFDLRVDPAEWNDLTGKYPGVAAILFAEIGRYAEWAARAAEIDPSRAGAEEYRPSREAAALAAPRPGGNE
jgi:hypothetical protein